MQLLDLELDRSQVISILIIIDHGKKTDERVNSGGECMNQISGFLE